MGSNVKRHERVAITGKKIDGKLNTLQNIPGGAILPPYPVGTTASVDPVIQITGGTTGGIWVYDATQNKFVFKAAGAAGTRFGVNSAGLADFVPDSWTEPRRNGFLDWTYDIAMASSAVLAAYTTGQISAVRLVNRVAGQTITGVEYRIGQIVAGSPANCYFGLYDANKNRIAVTADLAATDWIGALGARRTAFTSPALNVPKGDLWLAWLNGTGTSTTVRFYGQQPPVGGVNSSAAGSAAGRITVNSSQTPTSMPATLNITANSSAGIPWMGLY